MKRSDQKLESSLAMSIYNQQNRISPFMSQPKRIHIFDLDHTLVKTNTSRLFGEYLYRKAYFPLHKLLLGLLYYFRHKIFGLSLKKLHKKSFPLFFLGRKFTHLERHVESFLDLYLEDILDQEVLKCLRSAQEKNDMTILMSNSPDFLVKPIAKRLKFSDFRSSQYTVDKTDHLCHISSILCGKDKAKEALLIASEASINFKDLTAYTDSYLDIALLKAVGTPVVVNPDHRLNKLAKDLKWKIIKST